MSRIPLRSKSSITLYGTSTGDGKKVVYPKEFAIHSMIQEGGSVICYEAESGGIQGLLKEFYPGEAQAGVKRVNEYLQYDERLPVEKQRFVQLQEMYLSSCEKVMELRNREGEMETIFPYFEIYRGRDEQMQPEGTVYLWTPSRPCCTFTELCRRIWTEKKNPHKDLELILRCILELTRCVKLLHSQGLILNDIKPDNFGYYVRGKVLEQNISLFDFNGICDLHRNGAGLRMGTRGFCEPQTDQPCCCQSDIYSIGATLFYALFSPAYGPYKKEYFGSLRKRAEQSELLKNISTERQKRAKLLDHLTGILQRCLAERRADRYSKCEKLMEDLETALEYSGRLYSDVRNKVAAIQYDLYVKPLYSTLQPGEKELKLLLVGFDAYAQVFLDQCLPLFQMLEQSVNVRILCTGAQKKSYLKNRPALKEFFDLDGSLEQAGLPAQDLYGTLRFEEMPDGCSLTENRAAQDSYLGRALRILAQEQTPPIRSIFVSVGQDRQDLAIARRCLEEMKRYGAAPDQTAVRYVWRDYPPAEQPGLMPVMVKVDVSDPGIRADIQRMAYNAHRVWSRTLDAAEHKEDAVQFERQYYKGASAASILSIKWKLFRLGIDPDQMNPVEAACKYQEAIRQPEVCQDLVWREHRRWVSEKICGGWVRLELEDCPPGTNKKEKQHGCILRAGPGRKLKQLTQLYGRSAVWDDPEDKTIPAKEREQLDELEQFAVRLHRKNREYAVQAMEKMDLRIRDELHKGLSGDPRAWQAFQEWEACVDELCSHWEGSIRKERILYDRLLDAVRPLPNGEKMKEQLLQWEKALEPLRLFLSYNDYKSQDEQMVRTVPFILLYDKKMMMAVPYTAGDPSKAIGNAAAALTAWPQKLISLYYAERTEQLDMLQESLLQLSGLLVRKKMKMDPELVLLYHPALWQEIRRRKEEFQAKENSAWPIRLTLCAVKGKADIPQKVERILTKWQKKGFLVTLEKNETGLSYLLEGAGLDQRFGGFRFEPRSQRFTGCEALAALPFRNFITVADLIGLRGAVCDHMDRPQFFCQYKQLWEIYKHRTREWKQISSKICTAVDGGCSEKGDRILAEFDLSEGALHPERVDFAPEVSGAYESRAAQLIGILKGWGLLRQKQEARQVRKNGENKWQYFFEVRAFYADSIRKLFAADSPVWNAPDLLPQTEQREHAVICRILLPELRIWLPRETAEQTQDLLKDLKKLKNTKGEHGLQDDPESSTDAYRCFRCEDRNFKELLLESEKLLKVYVYHKLRASGQFDDVVSSYEVNWNTGREDPDINNEFDVLVTRGYRYAAIECKASSGLQPNHYFKLKALAGYFGGPETVCALVYHSEKKGLQANEAADRECGQRLGVHLISNLTEAGEIDRVDDCILALLR